LLEPASAAAAQKLLGPAGTSAGAAAAAQRSAGAAPAPRSPRLTQIEQAAPRPGFDGVAFLRTLAKVRVGGELTPAMETKLGEVRAKLDHMAAELEGAKSPAERAAILARAFANVGVPTPESHRTADGGQQAVVGAAVALVAGLTARTALAVHALPQVIALAAGTLAGGMAANQISAVLHHALDNYSFEQVPHLAKMAREFQDHHVDPFAVTKESWALTAYSSAVAVVPIVGAVLALNPGVATSALVGTIALAALMGQEGHKMSHRPAAQVPIAYDVAQLLGLSITRDDHAIHHVNPHGDHYAMISGNPSDDGPGFRRWEALIYRWTGVEPNSWKLDPSLRVEALGPQGYDERAVAAVALRDRELAVLKTQKRDQDARLKRGEPLGDGEARITAEDLRRKSEEIPDRHRIAPADHDGAQSPFALNLRTVFSPR
jgi:ubiquitin-conjugating enzyme E2 variant